MMKNRIKSVVKTLSIGVAGFIVGVGMMASHNHKQNMKFVKNIETERLATLVAQKVVTETTNHNIATSNSQENKEEVSKNKESKVKENEIKKETKKETKKKIKKEQPKQEQPKQEQSKQEEVKKEKPKQEQPKQEEVKKEKPKQEEVKTTSTVKVIKDEKGFLDPNATIEEMNTDVIQLKRTLTKSSEKECIFLDEGETYYEFTDGSFALSNPKNNKYSFQPVELGDWDYELKTQKDLRNVVFTYIENKTQLAHDNNYKVEI